MSFFKLFRPIHFDRLLGIKLYVMKRPQLLHVLSLLYFVACFGPWSKVLDVSGHVIDPTNGKPIPNAKVVISAWNYGIFDSNPKKFLVLTDGNGRFQLARKLDFLIRDMHFEASAPDNRYGSGGSSPDVDPFFKYRPPEQKGVNRYFFFPGKGDFRIEVFELPEWRKKSEWLQYRTFRGGIGGEPEHVQLK